MLLDFFYGHRRVSGTISIMLSLLLLPIYSVIALLIESARYRSANEQLGELTYMGELAVLSDYVEYLSDNYELYAYRAVSDSEAPFRAYLEKVKEEGGADTTALNRLFGIPIDQCDVRYMYSIADPKVLEYQIKEIGRYAVPAEMLSKFTLEKITKSLKNKFEKAKKILNVFEKGTSKAEKYTGLANNLLGMMDNGFKLNTDVGKLDTATENYKTAYNELINELGTLSGEISAVVDDPDYTRMYNMIFGAYGEKNRLNEKSTAEALKVRLNDAKTIGAFLAAYDKADSYFSSGSTESGGETEEYKLKLTSSVSMAFGRQGYITDTASEYDYENLLSKYNSILGRIDVSDFNLTVTVSVGSASGLNSTANSCGSAANRLTEFVEWCDKFESLTTGGASEKVNELKKKADALRTAYNTYAADLKAFIGNITSAVDQYDGLVKMQEDEIYDELNRLNEENHEDEYGSQKTMTKEEKAKNKKQRLKDYHTTQDIKNNYSAIGQNTLEKFAANVSTNEIENWQRYLENNYTNIVTLTTAGTSTDGVSASDYKSALKETVDSDNYAPYKAEKIIEKSELLQNVEVGNVNSQMHDVYNEVNNNKTKDNYEYKKTVNEDELYNIYSELVNVDGSVGFEETLSSYGSSDKAIYFSKGMIAALTAFLGASAVMDNETKDIFKLINDLIGLFENIKPADMSLNEHLSNDNFAALPSKLTFEDYGDERARALNYKNSVVSDLSGTGVSYYVDNNSTSTYNALFGNRNVGESIENIAKGTGEVVTSIVGFLGKISTFRIISAIMELGKLIKGIYHFITGLINLVIDIVQIIAKLIDNPIDVLVYLVDQFYIGAYVKDHFKSRQKAPTDISNLFKKDVNGRSSDLGAGGISCRDYNFGGTTGTCLDTSQKFYGAQQEYILMGEKCEILNQEYTYYAIFVVRLLLDFPVVSGDPAIETASAIPFVGPFIPFLVTYVEAKLDLFFMLGGYKVALIKEQMTLFDVETYAKAIPQIVQNFIEREQPYYNYNTNPDTGNRMRNYYDNNLEKQLTDKSEKTFKNSLQNKDSEGEGGTFSLDYEGYINILMLLYSEDTKAKRIADLIQMDKRSSDPTFKLSDCYTYIGADVTADFEPMLPLFSDRINFNNNLKLKNVQYNGY